MRGVLMIGGVGVIAVLVSVAFGTNDNQQTDNDVKVILGIHKELIEAHKNYDVDRLLAPEADEIIVVSRGEVGFQTKKERVPVFEQYLKGTKFDVYRDLIDPIVRVSNDGTLGWLIAQVRIVGNRDNGDGEPTKFESVWAWIELYEKRNGRWCRVGEVSNIKPNDP